MGDYAKALGSKLRAIRQQAGLVAYTASSRSLVAGGRPWSSGPTNGATARSRCRSWLELADFYGVPVAELLPEGRGAVRRRTATKIVINLERLQQLPADKVGPLARYAAAIQSQRGRLQRQGAVHPRRGPALPGHHLRT